MLVGGGSGCLGSLFLLVSFFEVVLAGFGCGVWCVFLWLARLVFFCELNGVDVALAVIPLRIGWPF